MEGFIHKFIASPTGSSRTILALHGTGGDENQILELARAIDPEASTLSPRGKSEEEEGYRRFFRRYSEGVFDVEDLKFRAFELAEWLVWAKNEYSIAELAMAGYSNGANIGSAVLYVRPDLIDAFINLRGMTPYPAPSDLDLKGKPILMISGEGDPIVPPDDANGLASAFKRAGAEVEHVWLPVRHSLGLNDVKIARGWLAKQALAKSY